MPPPIAETTMRKILLLAALGGAMALSACATSGGYVAAGGGYDYARPADDVWYDGYYGPYAGGYWGDGDAFFFRGQDGHYYKDGANHFQRHTFTNGAHYTARHHR